MTATATVPISLPAFSHLFPAVLWTVNDLREAPPNSPPARHGRFSSWPPASRTPGSASPGAC